MRLNRLSIFAFIAVAGVSAASAAQETAAAPAAQNPPAAETSSQAFDVHGSFDAGYRFRDLDGREATYNQIFDLSAGPRLFSVELYGKAKDAEHAFADTFALSASGLGGDPFPTVQLTIQKPHVYDVRFNWRQSHFFDTWPLTPASIGGFDTQAVTDNHSWDTTRQIGNLALTLYATDRLRFLFNADRVHREGVDQSTRSLDFLGSPSTWGAFARANPYPVMAPINETADAATGGVSYAGIRWSVHYKAGYHTYDESQVISPVATPETSVNVTDAISAGEPLNALGWSQTRRLTGPSSEFSYVLQPSSRLDWRGQYLFYRYRGPLGVDAFFQGIARTTGTAKSPYDVAVATRGEVTAPNHVVGQGFTYRPFNRWAFDVDYRYSHFSSDAHATLGSLLALYPPATATAPVATSALEDLSWEQAIHMVDVTATFEPTSALTIRPGIRWWHREVEMRADDVIDPATSDHERTYWPELTVGFRPSPTFSARGWIRSAYSDVSYTRMSPTRRNIANVMTRYEPREGLAIEASVNQTDAELLSTGFISHTRFGALDLSYTVNDRLILLGGIDYQSFLGTGSVTFLRGTSPIDNLVMSDREVDRIWRVGGTVKPAARFGITAMANFDRISGLDTIQGEPPLYGPTTFPYATGTFYYDVPRAGRFSVDLQHTHYYQDILSLNDFRATLVTIRYSRTF